MLVVRRWGWPEGEGTDRKKRGWSAGRREGREGSKERRAERRGMGEDRNEGTDYTKKFGRRENAATGSKERGPMKLQAAPHPSQRLYVDVYIMRIIDFSDFFWM